MQNNNAPILPTIHNDDNADNNDVHSSTDFSEPEMCNVKKIALEGIKSDTLPSKFTRRYLILNEIFCSVSHGIGFGLGVAALVVLIVAAARTGEATRVVSYTIYGSSLILLYLFSTLYHSLKFTRARTVMRVLDHSGIYVFIAGTYTPYCLNTIGGAFGWTLFVVIWALAVVGIVFKSIFIKRKNKLSTVIYIVMGWLCIIGVKQLYLGLGKIGFGLLLSGGLAFTIGAVFYSFKQVRYIHVLWHFFVILGTALMYFSILFYA